MSLSSVLLAAATGALTGRDERQQRDRAEQVQNLELMNQLGQTGGFTFGDASPAAAPSAPAAPAAGSGTTPPAALPPILRGAHSALGAPAVAGDASAGGAPAASNPATAPSHALRVGSLRIGGRDLGISFDPTQTDAALRRAKTHEADAANRAAFAQLEAAQPGSQGAYDPSYDYAAAARRDRDVARIKAGLKANGYSDQDAELLARYNIDLDAKRQERARVAQARAEAQLRQSEFAQRSDELNVQRLTQEAMGYLESGADPDQIGGLLKVLHPTASLQDLNRAVGNARSAHEVTQATVGQRNRSNQPTSKKAGLKVGGIELDPAVLGGSDSTGSGGGGGRKAPDALIDQLLDENGGDAAKVEAKLRQMGYSD